MNIALEIIDEQLETLEFEQSGNNGFVIDSDEKAEWALAKIREERAEALRQIKVCETMIEKYEEKIKNIKEGLPQKTAFLEGQLMKYFETVPHKKSKTMEKYVLPSGTLRKKYSAIKYKKDEETLIKWLKERNMQEYVKVKESPDWAGMKEKVKVVGDKVITEDGEVIEGVTVTQEPPKFEVVL